MITEKTPRSRNQQQKCCRSTFPAFSAAVVIVQYFTRSWFLLHCTSLCLVLSFLSYSSHFDSSPFFVVSAVSKIFNIKPSITLSFVSIHRQELPSSLIDVSFTIKCGFSTSCYNCDWIIEVYMYQSFAIELVLEEFRQKKRRILDVTAMVQPEILED